MHACAACLCAASHDRHWYLLERNFLLLHLLTGATWLLLGLLLLAKWGQAGTAYCMCTDDI